MEQASYPIGLFGFRGILADVVFIDRRLKRFLIGHLAADRRDKALGAVDFQRGAVAATAGDEQVGVAIERRAHQQRLEQAAHADRGDELVMLGRAEEPARIAARLDQRQRQGKRFLGHAGFLILSMVVGTLVPASAKLATGRSSHSPCSSLWS